MARRKKPVYRSVKDWRPGGLSPYPPEPIWPEFVESYLGTALWTDYDEEGKPLDDRFGTDDIAQESINEAIEESNDFIQANMDDLMASGGSASQHGHDFWLTRNGHGAGFWDRGYGAIGERLTAATKPYGEKHAYVGDDGKVYLGPG